MGATYYAGGHAYRGAIATLTATPRLKVEKITLVNKAGERAEMPLEVADTEASGQLGLMFRPSMDTDADVIPIALTIKLCW